MSNITKIDYLQVGNGGLWNTDASNYTPTISNQTNCTVTHRNSYYNVQNGISTVYNCFTINPTSLLSSFSFNFTAPKRTINFSSVYDVFGVSNVLCVVSIPSRGIINANTGAQTVSFSIILVSNLLSSFDIVSCINYVST